MATNEMVKVSFQGREVAVSKDQLERVLGSAIQHSEHWLQNGVAAEQQTLDVIAFLTQELSLCPFGPR